MGAVRVYIGGCGIVSIVALGRTFVGLGGMSMRTEKWKSNSNQTDLCWIVNLYDEWKTFESIAWRLGGTA